MSVHRSPLGYSLIDVLDRVLDKGIVIDAWVRVSLVGIDLLSLEARVVVASIATHLQHSDRLDEMSPIAKGTSARTTATLVGRQLPLGRRAVAKPHP